MHKVQILDPATGTGTFLAKAVQLISDRVKARAPGKYLTGLQWFLNKTGAAASNHFEAGGFIRSRAGIEHPDLQFTFMPLAVMPGTVETRPGHSFQVHIDLLRPDSLGKIEARSGDPRQAPAIQFNYLQSPRDREDFRRMISTLRRSRETAPLPRSPNRIGP